MSNFQMDAQDLVRGMKHFTKSNSPHLTESQCKLIFNHVLSQNLNDKDILKLIENINRDVSGNKLNNVDSSILSSSSLHILINKQLKNYNLETIFKDLFDLYQKDGYIDTKAFQKFLDLCGLNMSYDSIVYLSKIKISSDHMYNKIDYKSFIKLMETILKKQN